MFANSKTLLAALAMALIPSAVLGVDCCSDSACSDCSFFGVDYQKCWDEDMAYVDVDGTCTKLRTAWQGDCCSSDCINENDCIFDVYLDECYKESAKNATLTSFLDYHGTMTCNDLDEFDPKTPIVEGDPHFKTFGGNWFDYQGECDLVLVQAPNFMVGKPLQINVRTTIRYDYSFVEAAAVSLGDDIFEVTSFGHHALNGIGDVLNGEHTLTVGGFDVHHSQPNDKQHVFDIVVGPNENITISTFKDLVAVQLTNAHEQHYTGAIGIMGAYPDGDLVARDGVTLMSDFNAFGQEWQVQQDEPMLFRTARAPQAPTKCRLPSVTQTASRRLVSKDAAEKACAGVSRFEDCVNDVLAIGDLDLASAENY